MTKTVKAVNCNIKCSECGRFISYEDLKISKVEYTPLSEFGPEIIEWTCPNCDKLEDNKMSKFDETVLTFKHRGVETQIVKLLVDDLEREYDENYQILFETLVNSYLDEGIKLHELKKENKPNLTAALLVEDANAKIYFTREMK